MEAHRSLFVAPRFAGLRIWMGMISRTRLPTVDKLRAAIDYAAEKRVIRLNTFTRHNSKET